MICQKCGQDRAIPIYDHYNCQLCGHWFLNTEYVKPENEEVESDAPECTPDIREIC